MTRTRRKPDEQERARQAAARRRWVELNPEKAKESYRKYREANSARVDAMRKRYRTSERGRLKARDYRLRKEYGISQDTYDAMLADQRGVCAVCNRPEDRPTKNGDFRLAVDHDHATGAVRALLCHGCNSSMGLLGESPDRMRALAAYADKHGNKREQDAAV